MHRVNVKDFYISDDTLNKLYPYFSHVISNSCQFNFCDFFSDIQQANLNDGGMLTKYRFTNITN